MSQGALKSLAIECLRGSVQLFKFPFEKGKKLTFIYGENGTGKSTICDAFEFLGKGKVGSLENRGLGKTNRYWHTLGKKPGDVSVSLETTVGSCVGTIGKTEVVVTPPDQRPLVEVLRRSQIQSLIEAKPADRYAAISRFIDVTSAETSESALRDLIRNIESSRNIALARVQENQDSIQQFWEEGGKPGVDPILWAAGEVKRDTTIFDAEIKEIGKLQASYLRLNAYPTRIERAKQNLQTAVASEGEAQKILESTIATITSDAAEVVGVLQAAKNYLIKHPVPAVCPLCESAEKVDGLSNRISARLTSFSALQTAQGTQKSKAQEVKVASTQLESVQKDALVAAAEFDTCLSQYSWPTDIQLPSTSVPKDLDQWPDWLAGTVSLPDDWKKAEISRQDKKQFISTLKRALATYKENFLAQKELDVLLPRIKRALEIAEEERRRFTDATLSKIAEEVGRLYEIVHPGEGLNKISLELDQNKRASLEIGASFCGQSGNPPQAYFSDSHLDTLGLCIFLALAAMEKPGETILVLDDILASIDEPHVERLIEMLYDEAVKFRHCVITTHYRPWKQKLRWGWLRNGQCQFVELTKWTEANGITLIRSTPDIERLRLLLAETPPDPQLVCAKAGFILEAALEFLTQHYECLVPRRPDSRFTIGDLLPAVDKKLRQALKVEVLKEIDANGVPVYESILLAPYLDELTRIAQARNVFGCHFNALSFELLDADALGFGQQVITLLEILTDDQAGWPRNGKSGSYWATTGETRRLHPFKKPS
ncbi:MAG: AAA family ATPase [Desulfobulbaceae bacterium]|nr:AAA family ATPase [Desulfobulbaceae bacterium]